MLLLLTTSLPINKRGRRFILDTLKADLPTGVTNDYTWWIAEIKRVLLAKWEG